MSQFQASNDSEFQVNVQVWIIQNYWNTIQTAFSSSIYFVVRIGSAALREGKSAYKFLPWYPKDRDIIES